MKIVHLQYKSCIDSPCPIACPAPFLRNIAVHWPSCMMINYCVQTFHHHIPTALPPLYVFWMH